MVRRGIKRIRKRNNTNNKNKKIIIMSSSIIFIFAMFISVVFSLSNIGNKKIINGVKVGNIDVSNLTQEEALEKVKKIYQEKILSDVNVEYEQLEETIKIEQLNPSIDIDKIIREACLVGKSGNILKDNYEILFSMLFSKEIECNILLDEQEIDKKIEELNSKLPNAIEESNYYIEENNLIIKKGKSGIKIEEEKFNKLLYETLKLEENRKFEIPIEQKNPELINIEEIYKEIHKETKDAYITENPKGIHPEINGVDFENSLEEAKDILKEDKDEYTIPLKITVAEVTISDLGKEAFPHTLGVFSTTYSMTNANRATNLQLASEKINGTIILPGETFSYNKIVGERTIAKGYKEAAVYSGGKVVNGIGGGICQLSSTLYNAAVYSNLEITSRSNHRFMTSYAEAGRDATVSWGTVDLCFKNTRKFPIKIVSSVKNGVVTTEIYGMKEEKEYEIIIENKVTEVIPYTISYIKDNTLNDGTEEIKQYGANGAKSITYKITKYNGAIISKEILSTDTYSPLERIVKKGTKKTEETNAKVEEGIKQENINEINPELLKMIREL